MARTRLHTQMQAEADRFLVPPAHPIDIGDACYALVEPLLLDLVDLAEHLSVALAAAGEERPATDQVVLARAWEALADG